MVAIIQPVDDLGLPQTYGTAVYMQSHHSNPAIHQDLPIPETLHVTTYFRLVCSVAAVMGACCRTLCKVRTIL